MHNFQSNQTLPHHRIQLLSSSIDRLCWLFFTQQNTSPLRLFTLISISTLLGVNKFCSTTKSVCCSPSSQRAATFKAHATPLLRCSPYSIAHGNSVTQIDERAPKEGKLYRPLQGSNGQLVLTTYFIYIYIRPSPPPPTFTPRALHDRETAKNAGRDKRRGWGGGGFGVGRAVLLFCCVTPRTRKTSPKCPQLQPRA